MRKYYTLKNVLDIKFVTYNYEACVALMKDYPMVIGLAKKLKNDSTVKPKKKAMMEKLFRHMTDGRNFIEFHCGDQRVDEHLRLPETWIKREGECL